MYATGSISPYCQIKYLLSIQDIKHEDHFSDATGPQTVYSCVLCRAAIRTATFSRCQFTIPIDGRQAWLGRLRTMHCETIWDIWDDLFVRLTNNEN